jgi:hypothetical protein
MCMAFGIIYAMSCLLKAFNSFNALLFGNDRMMHDLDPKLIVTL